MYYKKDHNADVVKISSSQSALPGMDWFGFCA